MPEHTRPRRSHKWFNPPYHIGRHGQAQACPRNVRSATGKLLWPVPPIRRPLILNKSAENEKSPRPCHSERSEESRRSGACSQTRFFGRLSHRCPIPRTSKGWGQVSFALLNPVYRERRI